MSRIEQNFGLRVDNEGNTIVIKGAFGMEGILAPALSNISQGRVYFNSLEGKYKISENQSTYKNLVADNVVIVTQESDLPAPSGGVIPLANGVNYIVGVPSLIITTPLDLSSINVLGSFQGNSNFISYTGTGAMFQGTFTGAFVLGGAIIVGDGTNSIWGLTGSGVVTESILVYNNLTFVNFSAIGILNTLGTTTGTAQYANCGLGLVAKDIGGTFSLVNVVFDNAVTSNSPRLVMDGTFGNVSIALSPINIPNGESYIQYSKNFVLTGASVISDNTFNQSTGAFYASDITGAIADFFDNGSGGTTVTSAAHGLTIEQVVEITASGVGAYDAIHQDIFNITTNTFDIPVAFVSNPATGNFDTGDSNLFLDKNCFTTKDNGDQIDTNEIGKMTVNSAFVVTIATINTPVEINGGGADWTGDVERRFEFEAGGENDGTLKYIGLKPKEFRVSGKISFDAITGTSIESTAYIGLNTAIIINSAASLDQARKGTLYPSDVILLNQGDVVSLFIENNDGTQNYDIFVSTSLEIFAI